MKKNLSLLCRFLPAFVSLASTSGLLRAASGDAAASFRFPATGQTVERQAMLLGIDEVSWPFRSKVVSFMTKPTVRREPVLTPTRDNPHSPDFLAAHLYGTVLFDGEKFRMWYYAVHPAPKAHELVQGPICYAESADGIQWTKPDLGQVEFAGNRHNNIIDVPADSLEGVQVIKDDADPDPARRYKMIYNPAHPFYHWSMRAATSADGIHWKTGPEAPIQNFLEFASLYRHGGVYYINSHVYGRAVEGRMEGRQGYVWRSADFDHWLQDRAPSFMLPEPATGTGPRGRYDQVHLGTGAASFGNVVIGLYGLWHERGWGIGGTTCDFGLVLSQDGIHFYEPVKGHLFLTHLESPATPVPGKDYPTILTQSNSILNYQDETRIYHGRWRNAPDYPAPGAEDYWGEVALATLPRDRWGALGLVQEIKAPTEPGNFAQEREMLAAKSGGAWSMPITLPAGADTEIVLNADATAGIRVEIADEDFNPLPEYAGERSGTTAKAGGLDCEVRWPKGDLQPLRGRTIRLHVLLNRSESVDPRLYAVYFRTQ